VIGNPFHHVVVVKTTIAVLAHLLLQKTKRITVQLAVVAIKQKKQTIKPFSICRFSKNELIQQLFIVGFTGLNEHFF